ncbi:MAG: hypothetical protein IPM42_18395 [Saprospiraceae bacterium]|nr:hypothetical protein [Saprospiraceae bacterium]
MFNQNQINQIRKAASVHKVAPEKELWSKLETKLTEKRLHRTIRKYRNLLIAACGIFILSFAVLIKFYESGDNIQSAFHNQAYIPSDEGFKSSQNTGLYSVRQINELKEAYQRLGMDRKS